MIQEVIYCYDCNNPEIQYNEFFYVIMQCLLNEYLLSNIKMIFSGSIESSNELRSAIPLPTSIEGLYFIFQQMHKPHISRPHYTQEYPVV